MSQHQDELAQNLRAIVQAIQAEGPLACREIEMICHLGQPSASNCVKKLLEAGILERHRATRIVAKKPQSLPTGKYQLTRAYTSGLISLDRVGTTKPLGRRVYALGKNQRVVLSALSEKPKNERAVRYATGLKLHLTDLRKCLNALVDRELAVRAEDGWVRA